MAKDYGKKKSSHPSSSFSKQLLLVTVCLLVGYLSAEVFDFSSLSKWVNTQLVSHQTVPVPKKTDPQQAQLPKPKFEFYTLLASERPGEGEQAAKIAPVPSSTIPKVPVVVPTGTMNLATSEHPSSVPPIVPANGVSAKQVLVPVVNTKGAYLVQVAAFKSQQEAERMRALLVLKGFTVNIAMINQKKTNWYRVTLGPYVSRAEAQKAQAAVAHSEHIVGMVRKMDA